MPRRGLGEDSRNAVGKAGLLRAPKRVEFCGRYAKSELVGWVVTFFPELRKQQLRKLLKRFLLESSVIGVDEVAAALQQSAEPMSRLQVGGRRKRLGSAKVTSHQLELWWLGSVERSGLELRRPCFHQSLG